MNTSKRTILNASLRIFIYIAIGFLAGYLMLETDLFSLVPSQAMEALGIAYYLIYASVFLGVIPLFLYGTVSLIIKRLRQQPS